MTLQQHHEAMIALAKKKLYRNQKLDCLCIMSDADNNQYCLPYGSFEDRSTFLANAALMIQYGGMLFYSILAEAWMATDIPEEQIDTVKIAELPNRIEVLIIVTASKTEKLFASFEMLRDEQERFIGLKKHDKFKPEGGAMATLFEKDLSDKDIARFKSKWESELRPILALLTKDYLS